MSADLTFHITRGLEPIRAALCDDPACIDHDMGTAGCPIPCDPEGIAEAIAVADASITARDLTNSRATRHR